LKSIKHNWKRLRLACLLYIINYNHNLYVQVTEIREKIKALREKLSHKDQMTGETIRTAVNELQQASMKMFEVAYQKVCFFSSYIIISCISDGRRASIQGIWKQQ
jgi:hypothetical protein